MNERDLIARQVEMGKKKFGRPTPSAVDFAAAITDIQISSVLKGIPTLTVQVADLDWALVDSGFFDADENGKIDKIDVNYPDGSGFWWRLQQVVIETGPLVQMVFIARGAAFMMEHVGPYKISRGRVTRAQFIGGLAGAVRKSGGIDFVSSQWDRKQTQAKKLKDTTARSREKSGGINPDGTKLRIAGAKATRQQLRYAEIALDEADKLNTPKLATQAMMCAGIGESNFTDVVNSLGYGGVFQGQVSVPSGSNWFAGMGAEERTAAEAHHFLKGGLGYNQGGAIALANAHPDMDPGEIATRVETSGKPGSFYGKWIKEADALIDAYGGGFGGTEYVQQYNFTVGSTDNPHENFWDAATRLAEEVNWALFWDGNRLYYDPETVFTKRQRFSGVLDRSDCITYSVTWDERHIASEVTASVPVDALNFWAGQVWRLEGFGPASTGSAIGRPGAWLLEEVSGGPFQGTADLTFKQPEKPKREPRAATGERASAADVGSDVSKGMTPKEVIDQIALPIGKACGIRLTPLQVSEANARHGPTQGGSTSDHQGPPEHAWAVDFGIGPDIRGGGNQAGADRGDKLAKALAEKFGINWPGSGIASATHTGFRFQIIWRFDSAQAGNHYTHVHFGAKKVSTSAW